MIIKDINGDKLRLTKTELREDFGGMADGCSLDLVQFDQALTRNRKNNRSFEVSLNFLSGGLGTTSGRVRRPGNIVTGENGKIGCRHFTAETFAKIVAAAKATRVGKKSDAKKRKK